MRAAFRAGTMGVWLGWQSESNWTHPLLYALLALLRPVSATLILVFIYLAVAGLDTTTPVFANLFVGQCFFIILAAILVGVSMTIHEDREHYQMFRYVFIAPGGIYLYLMGRGGPRALAAAAAVTVNLALGAWIFRIPIDFDMANLGLFIVALLTGVLAALFLGIFLAGLHMLMARHSWFLGEGFAGLFYLVCGCIFTLDELPPWGQALGKALPFTYWFSILRRSLGLQELSRDIAALSLHEALGTLVVLTAILGIIAHGVYLGAKHLAVRSGRIDMVFNY